MTPEQLRERYKHGGRVSPGNFRNDPDRAVEAGRVGGFTSNSKTRGQVMTGRPPKLSPEQKQHLLFLFSTGTTRKELAALFRVHYLTVCEYINGTHKNPGLRA